MRRFRRPRRPGAALRGSGTPNRRGATSLEFALISVPMLMLILGGLELARYAATIASMRAVVDEAVRGATLAGYANLIADRGACAGLGAGTNLLRDAVPTYLLHRDRFTLTVTDCVTDGAITTVSISARYTHSFLLLALSARSGTFEETATAAFN